MIENFFLPISIAIVFYLITKFLFVIFLPAIIGLVDFFKTRIIRKDKSISLWPGIGYDTENGLLKILFWADIKDRFSKIQIFVFVIIIVFVSVILGNLFFLFIALVIISAGFLTLYLKAYQNKKRFISQLPGSLASLTDAISAGYSMDEALSIVARESKFPVSLVFNSLKRASDFQVSFEYALLQTEKEIQIEEWGLISETLRVWKQTGGSLVPLLSSLTQTLENRIKAENEIKSLTSAGKFSSIVIALLVPVSFLAMLLIAPNYISVLYTTLLGKLLLWIAVILELIGLFITSRIVKVKY